jgi:predicted P-loop ATPase
VLIDYLGAADTEYTRTVTRKLLVGAVARIMQPGIKFDNLIVLIGPEGSAKSQFIKSLGNEWFSESFGRIDSKEAAENLQGVWLMEIPELAAFKNAEVETIKHFISKQYDDFRPAYGRRVTRHPRQCIFIGTSNNLAIIKGHTGGRRFWPVVITRDPYFKRKVFDDLPRLRKQIWAEAVRLWVEGEDLRLPEDLEVLAREIQAGHTEGDPWVSIIQEYLDTPLPGNWANMGLFDRRAYLRGDETQPRGEVKRTEVTGAEIWAECLEGDRQGFNAAVGRRVSSVLSELANWTLAKSKKRFGAYGVCRYYYLVEDLDDSDL